MWARAGPAQKTAHARFNHWGAPKAFGGSNLAKNRRRYSVRPTPGGLKWRMHRIHGIYLA